jgi:DNA (cytosine-5)-methyltransferase 1
LQCQNIGGGKTFRNSIVPCKPDQVGNGPTFFYQVIVVGSGSHSGGGGKRGRGGNGGNGTGFTDDNTMYTLNATGVHGIAYGFEPGITKREGNPNRFVEEGTPTLRADMGDNQMATAHAFKMRGGCEGGGKGYLGSDEKTFTISTQQDQQIYSNMAVRRLTPVECERLQGFPDNYTNIPWRKKDESPDGPRYKAMGNSMAVPVMNWIGTRIKMVEELL